MREAAAGCGHDVEIQNQRVRTCLEAMAALRHRSFRIKLRAATFSMLVFVGRASACLFTRLAFQRTRLRRRTFAMNKLTKVALLGTFTAAFAFIGCGGVDDLENAASAGSSAAGAVAAGGAASTPPVPHAPASPGGSSGVAGGSSTAGAAGNSGGCVVSRGSRSRRALGVAGLALALALAARRRRRS